MEIKYVAREKKKKNICGEFITFKFSATRQKALLKKDVTKHITESIYVKNVLIKNV